MKPTTYSLAAGAVALSAATFAMPTLFKGALGDSVKVIGCFFNVFTKGEILWPTACAVAAQTDIGIVKSVSVADLHIDFTTSNSLSLGLSSTRLTALLLSIGVDWPITASTQHVTVVDNNTTIAKFDTPSSPASFSGGSLTTTVGDSVFNILPGQEDNFSSFIASLITKASHDFILQGSVDASFSFSIPALPPLSSSDPKTFAVTNVGFSSPITLLGCNSFPSVQYIKQVSLSHDASTGEFTLVSQVNIHNPSQLVLTVGDIAFNTVDKNSVPVGMTVLKGTTLKMGDNSVTVVTTSTSKDAYTVLTTAGDTFYFNGFAESSSNPILAKGLIALKISVAIPTLKGL